MTTKNWITCLALVAIGAIGIYLKGFCGGFMVGFAVTMLLLVTAGKWQLSQAAKKIDNRILDNKLRRV